MNKVPSKKAAKNNNLARYRELQKEKNEALVAKAIQHIIKLKGEITFSLVSKVTYDIADSSLGEKGLTLAGISKNKTYRAMIEKAQTVSLFSDVNSNNSPSTKLSIGDAQLSLHSFRVENSKLKMENKILAGKLKELVLPHQTVDNINDSVMKKAQEIQSVAHSMVSRLLELELAYIDHTDFSLYISTFDDLLVSNEALALFFEKELHELKSTIC